MERSQYVELPKYDVCTEYSVHARLDSLYLLIKILIFYKVCLFSGPTVMIILFLNKENRSSVNPPCCLEW